MASAIRKMLLLAFSSVLLLATFGHAGLIKPPVQVPVDSATVDLLLARLGRTQETVSYSGVQVRTVRSQDQTFTLRWRELHWQPERTLVTFLEPEELRGSQFVAQSDSLKQISGATKGRKIRHFYQQRRLLRKGRIFKEIAQLRSNYEIKAEQGPKFLGRATVSLKITPRHIGRPKLEALVDADAAILLRSKRWDAGTDSEYLSESTHFEEISYQEPPTALFTDAWKAAEPTKKRRPSRTYPNVSSLRAGVDGMVLAPKAVPTGFSLVRIKSVQSKKRAFVHWLYGDGLSFVSLFQYRIDPAGSRSEEAYRKRHRQSRWKIVRGEKAGVAFSIAGEIPEEELKEMAASLEPVFPTKKTWPNLSFYIAIGLILISLLSYATKRRREKTYA